MYNYNYKFIIFLTNYSVQIKILSINIDYLIDRYSQLLMWSLCYM